MNMNKAFLLPMFIFGLVLIAGCGTSQNGEGRVVFTMTDAAANMNSVSSVEVTVDKVEAHSEAEGWVTVSSESQTYDLLELKTNSENVVLADVELKEGSYDQVRLDISSVVVTDAEGKHEAKLPSEELKIMGKFVVEENSTSSVTFDFIADESLHVTGNGQYIMAPVVQFESRENVEVEIKSNNRAEINNGDITTKTKVGMDIDGNVDVGLKIDNNLNLSIGSNSKIETIGKIKAGLY